MRSRLGCTPVSYSWMLTRRSSSGCPPVVESTRYHMQQPLPVGSDLYSPVSVVRDLDNYLDSDMSVRSHFGSSSCFTIVRHALTMSKPALLQSMAVSLELSGLDFGNATLTGIPAYLLQRLQSVLNAAARLIFSSSRFDHISLLLCWLHWLMTFERITYKAAVLAYKYQHGLAPTYLCDELHRPAVTQARRRLHCTFCLINVSGRSTYSSVSVHCRRQWTNACLWNSLPSHVTAATSLPVFCWRLKSHLFSLSYPAFWLFSHLYRAVTHHFGHYNRYYINI